MKQLNDYALVRYVLASKESTPLETELAIRLLRMINVFDEMEELFEEVGYEGDVPKLQ